MARTPTFTAIEKWVEKSEIDYMTYFIKTWIPFNAWYNRNYDSNWSDRQKIEEIKEDQSNAYYKTISDLLENRASSQLGEEFRGYIGALHAQLEAIQLEYSNRHDEVEILSFTSCLKSKNLTNKIEEVHNGIRYYLERFDGQHFDATSNVKMTIKDRSGNTTFNFEHNCYDVEHTQNELSREPLVSFNQRLQAIKYLEELKPIIVKSALQEGSQTYDSQNYYECGVYKFVRDMGSTTNPSYYTTAALIEILYQLRNLLFHGQIEPTPEVQPIYKNAYLIMRMLIPKLT
jgi:hypothetical protein